MSKRRDDHPVRTIFLETVANRLNLPVRVVRKRLRCMTTARMDQDWPLDHAIDVVTRFGRR